MLTQTQELLALREYKKKARFVFMKLHKEIETLQDQIKLLEFINAELQKKLKK